MTTKHMTDNTSHDTDETVHGAVSEMSEEAEDTSRQLLAKARYDAFRLMTEARDEAETILEEARAEAKGTKDAADITAASTTESAEVRASEIVESAHQEAATIVASAHRRAGEESPITDGAVLEAEHKALSDRVSTLRTLADQLEDRFAALARTASPTPTEQSASAQPRTSEAPILDYSPAVPPKPKAEPVVEAATPDVDRDSFYNRRSAKLPSLGEDGGRSALDMTRTMRQSLDAE